MSTATRKKKKKQEGADLNTRDLSQVLTGNSCNIKAAGREDNVADRVSLDLPAETSFFSCDYMNLAKFNLFLKHLAGHLTLGCNSSSKAAQSILLIYKL